MSISFFGFDIAISGLHANQKALEVTGHNVSNLGTVGYSRQGAVLKTAHPKTYGSWQVESGVDVGEVRQIRNLFQDGIYRTESNSLGYWETRYSGVSDVEAILGEPMQDGLQTTLNKFWDSWQELSKAPESLTIRSQVLQRADALVSHFNQVGERLDKLQNDFNTEISKRVSEVNDITKKIAKLNVDIISAETARNQPNDWYDQRNTLIDQLSKLVKADVTIMQDGSADVVVGGYFLVSKGESNDLTVKANLLNDNYYDIKYKDTSIDVDVKQGIIKALQESRGATRNDSSPAAIASSIRNQLNELVKGIVTEVNALHTNNPPAYTTYDLQNNPGLNFFQVSAGPPAQGYDMDTIKLNFNDFNKIVTSSMAGAQGDNRVAQNIANLRNTATVFDGTANVSLDTYYQNAIMSIGNKGRDAEAYMLNQQQLVTQADNIRQGIMGVSLDEEMANMIKYKYAYNAASKSISAINEMIDTVINKLGVR